MKILRIGTEMNDLKITEIDGSLSSMQEVVGGHIEPIFLEELTEHKIVMIANEEGVLKYLPLNENLSPFFFVGTLFVCGYHRDELTSISNKQLAAFFEWLDTL